MEGTSPPSRSCRRSHFTLLWGKGASEEHRFLFPGLEISLLARIFVFAS